MLADDEEHRINGNIENGKENERNGVEVLSELHNGANLCLSLGSIFPLPFQFVCVRAAPLLVVRNSHAWRVLVKQ